MPEPQVADHGALAVPRKIAAQFQERDVFVTEALDIDAANDAELRRVAGKIGGAGKLEERRRIEGDIGEELRETGCVEKSLRVERASALEIRRVLFPAPVRAPGESAQVIRPGALINVERLIRPLGGEGQVRYFVIAATQSFAGEDRFRMDGFELRKVPGEFYLER